MAVIGPDCFAVFTLVSCVTKKLSWMWPKQGEEELAIKGCLFVVWHSMKCERLFMDT